MLTTEEQKDLIQQYYDNKAKKHMMKLEKKEMKLKHYCESCDSTDKDCKCTSHTALIAGSLILLVAIPSAIYITHKCIGKSSNSCCDVSAIEEV